MNTSIKRGDIYWIEQSKYRPTVGSVQSPGRPAIIVSNDANNACSYTLEVVYLTGQPKKDLPTHCTIRSSQKPSIALCEQVTTVSSEQLREYVGHCTEEEMEQVDRCIAISLGLPTPEEQPGAYYMGEVPESLLINLPTVTDEEVKEMEATIARQEKLLAVANGKVELLRELYNDLLGSTVE